MRAACNCSAGNLVEASPSVYESSLCLPYREALQALVSPTDAQLALCSAGAYGEKEGEGALRDVLPAQIELEKLSKRWNVPTGCVYHQHVPNCHRCCCRVQHGILAKHPATNSTCFDLHGDSKGRYKLCKGFRKMYLAPHLPSTLPTAFTLLAPRPFPAPPQSGQWGADSGLLLLMCSCWHTHCHDCSFTFLDFAGGLRAVAQIEDGAVGLGMTTFVSKVQSITARQKVQCHAYRARIVCSCMQAGHPVWDPQTCIPALTTLKATIYLLTFNGKGLCMTQQKMQTCVPVLQVAAAVFVFRGTVLTKRSNFAADLDVWRNANRDLYFAARAVKHLRLEMAQLQRQYPGVQWGFFCTGVCHVVGGITTPLY